eukprot:5496578-Amphidinium_carterae.1
MAIERDESLHSLSDFAYVARCSDIHNEIKITGCWRGKKLGEKEDVMDFLYLHNLVGRSELEPKTSVMDEIKLRRKSAVTRVAKDSNGQWTEAEFMAQRRRFCELLAVGVSKVEDLTFSQYLDQIYRFTPTGSGSFTLKAKRNKIRVKIHHDELLSKRARLE